DERLVEQRRPGRWVVRPFHQPETLRQLWHRDRCIKWADHTLEVAIDDKATALEHGDALRLAGVGYHAQPDPHAALLRRLARPPLAPGDDLGLQFVAARLGMRLVPQEAVGVFGLGME